jgi:pimeloyl-ACP methyl ester carboxylesterase
MSWFALERDGIALQGRDERGGLPVVFQHGLGGNEAQVAEVFPDGEGFRRLTLECRGQGQSPAGDVESYSIATFADDVLAFATQRRVERFVVGGISMGAAIALGIAARQPERVTALVLARPAWLWDPAPASMRMYAEVAMHLRNPDASQACADFEASATAATLAREAPGNLDAMRKFLAAEDRVGLAALLSAIAGDGPGVSAAEARAIAVPTLVIGTGMDLAHPLAFAQTLAATISDARLVEITPKATDAARYVAEFRMALSAFLSAVANSKGYLS